MSTNTADMMVYMKHNLLVEFSELFKPKYKKKKISPEVDTGFLYE
jgi:hypothetical protein